MRDFPLARPSIGSGQQGVGDDLAEVDRLFAAADGVVAAAERSSDGRRRRPTAAARSLPGEQLQIGHEISAAVSAASWTESDVAVTSLQIRSTVTHAGYVVARGADAGRTAAVDTILILKYSKF